MTKWRVTSLLECNWLNARSTVLFEENILTIRLVMLRVCSVTVYSRSALNHRLTMTYFMFFIYVSKLLYTNCLHTFPAVWLTDWISDTCKVSFLISRLGVCTETVFFFPSLKLQTHIDVRRLLYPFVQSMGIQNLGDWSLVSY